MILYNELDKGAAAWLRELIKDGYLPEGTVDERDIRELSPGDCVGPSHFFAGIGGWPYALHLAGWPDGLRVWTGSCPCQPLSCAGKRKGHTDERHLWPVWFNLIRECKPPVIFGEQVASKDGLEWLDGVFADLEDAGYACGAADLCSAGVGSPNIRQRLYWVAVSTSLGHSGGEGASTGGWEVAQIGQDGHESGRNGTGVLGTTVRPRPACRLADAERAEPGLRAGAGCGSGGLGNANRAGLQQCSRAESVEQELQAAQCGSSPDEPGGMDSLPLLRRVPMYDSRDACVRVPMPADRGVDNGPVLNFWSSSRLIPCRDGKLRRIPAEPELFPLATGIPGRVGLLRGAGNAINPYVAKVFIEAVMDVLGITPEPAPVSPVLRALP